MGAVHSLIFFAVCKYHAICHLTGFDKNPEKQLYPPLHIALNRLIQPSSVSNYLSANLYQIICRLALKSPSHESFGFAKLCIAGPENHRF